MLAVFTPLHLKESAGGKILVNFNQVSTIEPCVKDGRGATVTLANGDFFHVMESFGEIESALIRDEFYFMEMLPKHDEDGD